MTARLFLSRSCLEAFAFSVRHKMLQLQQQQGSSDVAATFLAKSEATIEWLRYARVPPLARFG